MLIYKRILVLPSLCSVTDLFSHCYWSVLEQLKKYYKYFKSASFLPRGLLQQKTEDAYLLSMYTDQWLQLFKHISSINNRSFTSLKSIFTEYYGNNISQRSSFKLWCCLRTSFPINIHIFDQCKMTWCTLASYKENFNQLLSSGEELLHNEAHSTSRITLLIFQWVNLLLP